MINVMLIDDQLGLLEANAFLLRSDDIQVVAKATSGAQAMSALNDYRNQNKRIHVTVVDYRLEGDERGPAVVKSLAAIDPSMKFIAQSSFYAGMPIIIEHFKEAGVHSFLDRADQSTEALRAIRMVARGGDYVSPEVYTLMRSGNTSPLTPGELKCAILWSEDYTVSQTAEYLGVGEDRVSKLRRAVLDKLGPFGVRGAGTLTRWLVLNKHAELASLE